MKPVSFRALARLQQHSHELFRRSYSSSRHTGAREVVERRALPRLCSSPALCSRCLRVAWPAAKPTIKVTFRLPNGKEREVITPVGTTMLEAAQENGVDIEGACGGEAACSTCHVIVDANSFSKLGKPSEEEIDMLDLAAGLTKT
jgi:ferredoxin, 2Fe-2S